MDDFDPCVTAGIWELPRSSSATQLFHEVVRFWRYILKREGRRAGTHHFVSQAKPRQKTPRRTHFGAQSFRGRSSNCRPALLPSTHTFTHSNWHPSREKKKKRQSLLTLHARGWSVESNLQGDRYICIPLEDEDKLNQHLTSTEAAAGFFFFFWWD